MHVLAADGYILCCGLLRTLALIYHNVRVTPANSVDEALDSILKLQDLALVLLDTSMPGMENFRGLRRVVANLRDTPVIVTSAIESYSQAIAAIRNGARGYISPSSKPLVLEHALRLIMSGEVYIPASAIRSGNACALLSPGGRASRVQSADDGLTSRQREIAVKLAEGKSNKEIARELKVLEGTVKLHVRGILRNFGVRNRTEAAIAAVRAGYLPDRTLTAGPPSPECARGNAHNKAPETRASSLPFQLGTKHWPQANSPLVSPACSARGAYNVTSDLAKAPPVGRLHRRTRRQRPRSRDAPV